MATSSTQPTGDYYTAVPEEMKSLPNWVGWRLEPRDGKTTKIPYSATGVFASSTDPQTWREFSVVCQIPPSNEKGIGFVFDGHGIVGIDLDHCLDENGALVDSRFADLIRFLKTYTEVSPSGRGLHLILKCSEKPYDSGARGGGLEIYCEKRYFTVTGKRWGDTPTAVNEFPASVVRALCEPFVKVEAAKREEAERAVARLQQMQARGCAHQRVDLSDDDIINIASSARNSDKFDRLMRGITSDHDDDDSTADMALASILAFYTTDANQIERIMRMSRLARGKWDTNKQYLSGYTIPKAISLCVDHYEPRFVGDAAHGAEVTKSLMTIPQPTSVIEYEPEHQRFDRKQDEIFDISKLPSDNLIRMFVEYGCEIQDAYPEFHLANILTLLSYVAPARMELSYGDTWNNVWFIVLGKAGQSGKSTAQSLITEIYSRMDDMNKPTMIPNKVTPERLTQLMAERDTRLWMVDEASGFMKSMKRDYASENTEVILKIYSHTEVSKSTVVQKNARGEIVGGGDIRCENPHVGMCWYTTPEMFSKYASRDLFDNGFYMRPMFMLPNRAKAIREDRGRTESDCAALNGILACINELNSAASMLDIKFGDNSKISRWKHTIRTAMAENTELTSMQGGGQTRSFEHVRKLAMLLTIASEEFMLKIKADAGVEAARKQRVDDELIANPSSGVVYTPINRVYDIPDWAADIAIEWGTMFYNNYERAVFIAYSNNGGAIETIIKMLEDANGGWVPKLKLQDAVKKYGRQWDEISRTLLMEGEIEEVQRKQRGRGVPRTEYRLARGV